ncbi:hypothetical protein CSA08_04820 [Candidatus Gracilibacteria bacterium]|nr:MAG: hypothetical protein CSA08_04820 [Candidatus Gracilibacteria bacterium]
MRSFITFGLCGIIFTIAGMMLGKFKMYNLIAGYNTMQKKDKFSYNIEPVAKILSIFLYILGVLNILMACLFYFINFSKKIAVLIVFVYVLIVVLSCIFLIISINKNSPNLEI